MPKTNLDALISREDFEVKDSSSYVAQTTQTIQIRDLEKEAFFYNVLRKPDFQRETSEWSPEKTCDFIESFLNGDLIPAIILWNSGAYTFVIDGAHRLSALISWVNDDYGDGFISKSFFEQAIDKEQLKKAEQTRRAVKRRIGSYLDHKQVIKNPIKADTTMLERAQRLATLALQLQWVKGDSKIAEASFFKINQKASPIDKTELTLLQSRNKPNALAARAIIRAGTGHKYWAKFDEQVQEQIKEAAKEINNTLFDPEYKTPIKTLDLPIAGQGYSSQTLSLIFDLVNISNNVKSELSDDLDGHDTVKYINNTKKIINRLTSSHPGSLGLHPVVYFYSLNGRYQPTAFLATIELIKELDKRNEFINFTNCRAEFEKILLNNKDFVNQFNYKYGSGLKGYKRLTELYLFLIDNISKGKKEIEIRQLITKSSLFSFLKFEIENPDYETTAKDFSTDTKSSAFIAEALKNPLLCPICNGLIHVNSISVDHKIRKQDGGVATLSNAQITHLYCNTTYKN